VAFPYAEVFLGLLVAYMAYSIWAGLDPRYPIGGALVLLVVTAVVDALGNSDAANTLAEYVFFLLGAGVLLLLFDYVREGRVPCPEAVPPLGPRPEPVPTETTGERQGPAEDPFDRLEQ
jgi:hypothetical protein